MKKRLLFLSLFGFLGAGSQLSAQILYSEDFDNINGSTAGGAGTYLMAPGMLLRNVDNRTPDAAVSYVNEAWERREDFGTSVVDSVAFSTSWYAPIGAANDFMWTPVIGPLPAGAMLSWNAKAYDPAYPDGYEVRVMTVAPTGGTGVIGNQITNSTVVFSTAAEATAWTSHSVSLAAYAGQSVYVGFRNSSNNQFLLVVDDILVQVQINYDAQILTTDTMQYTIEPQSQRTPNVISAVVRNNGLNSLSNVRLQFNVYDGTMTQVYTNTSTALPTLTSNATSTFTIGSYTPPATPDFYTYEYVVLHNNVDQAPANDTVYRGVLVDDSTYARDNGTVTGSLGIGVGNGYLGQQFEVVSGTDPLTSVSCYITLGYTGRRHALVIWDMLAGVPNQIIAYTDTLLYPDDSARVYTNMIDGGPILLAPGNYVVTGIEFDSTLAIGLTDDIFRTNTTWVNWVGNPFGTWANNEDFGAGFEKAYVIRPNFGDPCLNFASTITSTSATCGSCTDGSASVTATGGEPVYTYSWSPSGGNTATASNLGMGVYTVTVTDAFGCVITPTVMVGNDCSSYDPYISSSTIASCGVCNDGTATVLANNGTGPFTYLWTNGDVSATADSLLPGNYSVTITDAFGCSDTAQVNITFSTGLTHLFADGAIDVYPNPAEGNFELNINFSSASDLDIEIYNSLGQVIMAEHRDAYSMGKIPFKIETAGMYTIKVRNADGVRAIPVLIK